MTTQRLHSIENEIYQNISAAVNKWFIEQCKNPFEEYYFYFSQPTATENGNITIATDAPSGYQLGNGQRISPAWTEGQAANFIREHSRRLPICKFG